MADAQMVGKPSSEAVAPGVALVTRLALLELLTTGSTAGPSDLASKAQPRSAAQRRAPATGSSPLQSVAARTQAAQEQLDDAIKRYKAVVHFVADYSRNRPFLLPEVAGVDAASSTLHMPPSRLRTLTDTQSSATATIEDVTDPFQPPLLSPQSIAALLLDAEVELKIFEQNLRACEHLGERNVAGTGRLEDYKALLPQIEEAKRDLAAQTKASEDLERRALNVMERYSTQVDTVSRIFINWDDALSDMEREIGRLERRRRA